ncbi:hypothetical protein OF83DRAFT_1117429 [Amylostereum chailletii]|nr:hypothetical protein OF83DRAFT_1117429 [Amylostereum chailletii]
MVYMASTTWQDQQSNHQSASRGPVSALSSRKPPLPVPTMANIASSSQASPTSAAAGPSRIPRESTSAFPFSTMEFYGQGLHQTLKQDNNLSSTQSFEGILPRALLISGTSSSAGGSTVPPANCSTKRTHDALDESSRCLISGCNKVFNRHRDLVRHQTQSDAHRGPDAPYFHCTYCWGLSSARPDNVRRHFRTWPRGKLVYEGPIAYLTMAKAKAWKASIDAEGWSMTQGAAGGSDDGNGVEGDRDASDGDDVGGGSMLDNEDD